MNEETIRLNKFLSASGYCSRREADRLIEAGSVYVDGEPATLGTKVDDNSVVTVNGVLVSNNEKTVLIAFNKPRGIVCTSEKREKNNIIDYIKYPARIYPIGRLDKDSTGLILLTNQGEIVNKMMRARNGHEKEYVVRVNKRVTDDFIHGMSGGVPLVELNTTTRKCKVKKLSEKEFSIVLTQGLNRQIRRMCEYFGYRVTDLKRTRIMNIYLNDLPEGEYRDVTPKEYNELLSLIGGSEN
ncbi:MAG: 23S rRNA pseudouridine(2604) synthase RluF [Lachnospiraceae bacterium]|nr:23S rRNA pseudouridine(2604) synthase RluF [Lachnospiraceae bacterium]